MRVGALRSSWDPFRLCYNNIRLRVTGTGRRRRDAIITLAPVTHSGVSELKPAFAVYVSNYLGWEYPYIPYLLP